MRTNLSIWLTGVVLFMAMSWVSAQPPDPPAPPGVPKPPVTKDDEPPPPVVPATDPTFKPPAKQEVNPPNDASPIKPAGGMDRSVPYTPPAWRPSEIPQRGFTKPVGPPEPGLRIPDVPATPTSPLPTIEAEKGVAMIEIRTASDATIWIGTQRMTQQGPVRLFQSPPIERGRTYYYVVRISWPGAATGQSELVKEQEVAVRAGQTSQIDLNPPMPVAAPTPVIEQPIIVPAQPQGRPVIYPRFIEGSGRRR